MEQLLFWVVQGGLTLACCALLLKLAFPGEQPWTLALTGLHAAGRTPAGRRGTAALVAFLGLGYLQNLVDPWFTRLAERLHGVEDFAVWIHAWEGGLTANLQVVDAPLVVGGFLFVYVCLFPALWGLLFVGLQRSPGPGPRAGIRALWCCYLLALPFFLFVPVRETWFAELGPGAPKARLMLDLLPGQLEPLFRDARGIENNFPSLHTACSLIAWDLLRRCGSRRLAWIGGVAALLVVISTLYLGFHWLSDMLAGAACAWISVRVALRGETDQSSSSSSSSSNGSM